MTFLSLEQIPDQHAYDVIVVGGGGAGLAAALFAALAKQRVLLIERTEFLGGTTALSGATTWVPNSLHASKVNPHDTPEAARAFLDGVVGNHAPSALREAFLAQGPHAIAILEQQSHVRFRPYPHHPDYEQQIDGATTCGRALEPLPFDGRLLGEALSVIRPPIPEFTIFGGMMVDRTDIGHLLNLTKKWTSLRHAARILSLYGLDLLRGSRRGSRLVMGNALIGRLLYSLMAHPVDFMLNTHVERLVSEGERVTGLVAQQAGVTRKLLARAGVILAAGGFNHHPQKRTSLLRSPVTSYSPAAPGHTGSMQDLALALGAHFAEGGADHVFWAPVSVRKRSDGSTAVFPHFVMDRSKPGTVCVNQKGERFTNEAQSYHLFVRAMLEADKTTPTVPAFIVTDARGLHQYGLGMVRMGTKNLDPFIADGYLLQGHSIAELAAQMGADAATLTKTLADMNHFAETGVDPQFGRGTTAYHRANGDAGFEGPNPCLGPIAVAPFYAVRLYPGDIGAAAGLAINAQAQVLREGGHPIQGLYACGNEAQSIAGGTYPGPGITLGPALTFAYCAIQHCLADPSGAAHV